MAAICTAGEAEGRPSIRKNPSLPPVIIARSAQ
jgi:hypothetical protein